MIERIIVQYSLKLVDNEGIFDMVGKINTLNTLFKEALNKHSEKTALVIEGQSFSYKELKTHSNRVAHALLRNGVTPNTRVALMMDNCFEYVVSDLGIILAGATKVPLNNLLGENEIEYILNDSNAEIVIVGESFVDRFQNIRSNLPNIRIVVAVSNQNDLSDSISWGNFQASEPETDVEVQVNQNDLAFIIYTGGTTGMPKGVVHDQGNVFRNLHAHLIEMEILQDEKILLMSPLPHSAGIVLQAGLLKGAEHWIEKGFDPQLVIDRIHDNKITFTFMVPTMIYRVLDQIKDNRYDLTSLRTIIYGAAPISDERLKQGLAIFGQVFTQLYGQSEAPNLITVLRKDDHRTEPQYRKRLRSCGKPVMTSLVKVIDEMGNEVPRGTEGEIVTNTPYNMIRYHGKPDVTEETLRDGWLHTGDIGMIDEDGYLYLLDRKKDMIISGGMNVYSTEIENLLQKHPGVLMVSVIGVPHPDWGEAVMAIIVPNKENPPTEDAIRDFCQQLSKYKRPKEIKFVESLPLTPYGKIDKKALRKNYWELQGRAIN